MTKVDNKFLEETWDVTGKLFAKVVEKIIPISNLDDLTEDNIERFVEWSKKRFFGDNKNLLDIICDEIRKEIYDYLKISVRNHLIRDYKNKG